MSISVKTIFSLALCLGALSTQAQQLDSIFKRNQSDTYLDLLNMEANQNRPTLNIADTPVNIGGYFEANSIYSTEDGDSDGFAFQARRLSLIISAPIMKRVKFLSEIEFEDGGEEIEIEYAALDVTFSSELNLRGGIIINPIGAFNQNHDGPKWEFVERPDEAVNLLPGTFSNAGVGLYGKFRKENWIFGYEAYITNGFNENIINNPDSRTSLPATKEDNPGVEEDGDEDFENYSGKPLFTGKIAIKNTKIGEIGLSYMGGVYNRKMNDEGLQIRRRNRQVDVVAVDFNTTIKATKTKIIGEAAYIG